MTVLVISISSLALALGWSSLSTAKPHHTRHKNCLGHPTTGTGSPHDCLYRGFTSQGQGIDVHLLRSKNRLARVLVSDVYAPCADGSYRGYTGGLRPLELAGPFTNGGFSISETDGSHF